MSLFYPETMFMKTNQLKSVSNDVHEKKDSYPRLARCGLNDGARSAGFQTTDSASTKQRGQIVR